MGWYTAAMASRPGSRSQGRRTLVAAWLAALPALALACHGQAAPPPLVATLSASTSAPVTGSPATFSTVLTHNLHLDPRAQNAAAASAALLQLHQGDLVLASHAYIPNTAAGVWNFAALDAEIDFLRAAPLPGTFIFNPAHCPAYLSTGGIAGARPADNAAYAQYLQRLVQYYNTPAGFTDGATTYKRAPVGIGRFEIWGEPDLNEFFDDNALPVEFAAMTAAQASLFLSTPDIYRAMYEAVAPAIKSADPTVRVGGPAVSSIEDPAARAYVTRLLGTAAPLDFVSYHDYSIWTRASSDAEAFAEIAALVATARSVKQDIAASAHPQAELWVTEGNGNGVAYVAPTDARASNDFDVPYLASLVRGYALAGVAGVARFELMEDPTGVYAALDSTGARRPAFWGWKLLSDHLVRGGALRATASSADTVEALAVQPDPTTLHICVINRTVRNASDNSSAASAIGGPAEIHLTLDHAPASATLDLVDPSAPGIQSRPLAFSGASTTFSLSGYGLACLLATGL